MNLIDAYLEYKLETEPPLVYHRWSIMSGIAALLGRKFYLPFGSGNLYPNLYVMLIGGVGTRKSSAIKDASRTIGLSGYKSFSARKTSKEKFLMDLEGISDDSNFLEPEQDITQLNLFGGPEDLSTAVPKETFITADEFNLFTTGDKLDFYEMLGDLWDWDRPDMPYTSRIKNSKTGGVSIFQPTVNILGGNTPENFSRAFPPEVLGQGFMSRLLIILGEPSGRKYHMPRRPSAEDTDLIVSGLRHILNSDYGEAGMPEKVWKDGGLVDQVYREWNYIDDVRFRGYAQRRYTQLLKMSLTVAASLGKKDIDEEVIILTNTILSAAERNMVKALGEFGKNKDSDVVNNVLTIIREATSPVSPGQIWKAVNRDLSSANQVTQILHNLKVAEVIQFIPGKGWLPLVIKKDTERFVDWSLLTQEERNML